MVEVVNTVAVAREDAAAVNSKAQRTLYAARVKIHPKTAHGTFRRLKWIILTAALAIYYVLPWLRWDRGVHAPDQAVLVDLAHRRFYFFFIEIWPQEFYYVAGLLIMAGIGLFLVTSLVGRAWCGYACPQTVWTDLFVLVEGWIEGDRNARIKLDTAPWGVAKLTKRVVKTIAWLLIAAATGGAWIFYFADAPSLARDFVTGTAAPVAYMTVGILTATTFIFAGYMREQVCTYMCPWPRIQGAMTDEDSLIVTYQAWRGEPRSGHRKKLEAAGQSAGDCIDCNACVAVCPMGIDIRDGNQLECINCALCIDACNAVMEKTGSPRDLISYATLRTYNAAAAGHPVKPNWHVLIRPRTLVYAGIWALAGMIMLSSLLMRHRLAIEVVPDRNPLFVTLSDGAIRNGYTVKILNMNQEPRSFRLMLEDLPGGSMSSPDIGVAGSRSFDVKVDADKLRAIKVYVQAPASLLRPGRTEFRFGAIALDGGIGAETSAYEAIFHGPGSGQDSEAE